MKIKDKKQEKRRWRRLMKRLRDLILRRAEIYLERGPAQFRRKHWASYSV